MLQELHVRDLALVDTAEFRRLAKISQLGLVGLVYPAAIHTRFEHSLGVYRLGLLFLRQLSYDPRFEAIVSADRLTAVGMATWQSDGFHPNGDRFDRPGRTTVTLGRKAVGDPFVATHTHMSLFRGTPEQSFGTFTATSS